jgi:hypothetical protein
MLKKGWGLAGAIGVVLANLGINLKKLFPQLVSSQNLSDNDLEFWVATIQAAVILLLLIFASRLPQHGSQLKFERASRALEQFQHHWNWLWLSFFLFYLALAVRAFFKLQGYTGIFDNTAWDIVLNLFNNMQGVFLLLCYLVLAEPTVGESHSVRYHSRIPQFVALLVGIALVNILAVVALPAASSTQAVKSNTPAAPTAAMSIQEAGIGAQPSTDPAHSDDRLKSSGWTRMVFQLMSGLFVGVALALLVGRFESKYIDAPRFVLVLLYMYALIQLMYVEFSSPQYKHAQDVFTGIALPLKLLLFAFVAWLYEKGRLLFYLEHVKKLHDAADADWKAFVSPPAAQAVPAAKAI